MNTIFKTARRALAALVLAGAGMTAAQAQYIGGDLNLDVDDRGDVFILAADISLRGRVGGDVEGAGADVWIDADVGGDISMAAADFRLTGRVGGDVNVGAADVNLEGEILGNANLGAADITLTGRVEGDFNAGGALVTIEESGHVGGDAELGGREVVVRGTIMGAADISARELRIAGTIEGPVEIRARRVYIDDTARIGGAVTIEGPNEPVIGEGAEIPQGWTYTYAEISDREFGDYEGPNFNFKIGPPAWAFSSIFAFSAFVLGMLAALIAPRSVGSIAMAFHRRPWVSGLLGLVVLALLPVLVPTLIFLLAVTIIGIPLALIVIFMTPIVLFLGFAFGGMALGDLAFNRTGGQAGLGLRALSFLVAIAAVAAIGAIPFLGWLVAVIVLCIGLGAWSLAIFTRQNRPPAGEGEAV